MVPLKYLSNFWRTLEMSLINCWINLIVAWYMNSVISKSAANQANIFAITDTKICIPVVTLSTQDQANCKTIAKLKIGTQAHN